MNDDQTSQPLTGYELDNIEGRWQRYVALRDADSMETSVHDVPDLLAEVDRLRAENTAVKTERNQFQKMMSSTVSAGVTIDGERLDALREVERLKAQGAAIVALHKPTAMDTWGTRTCQHCDTPGYYQEWPCPTLVAMGFEER